jgi:exosome complex exonuclease RRP6
MLSYARSDTHFLLYIYDNLRNALLDRALSRSQSPQPSTSETDSAEPARAFVREVLRRSQETALRLHETDVYDAQNGSAPGGWDGLARKWNKVALMASSRDGVLAKEVYKCVHDWRDRVSRLEDESTGSDSAAS